MFNTKTAMALLAAVFALSAATCSSAYAATAAWMVNGTDLAGTEEFVENSPVTEAAEFEAAGVAFRCPSGTTHVVGSRHIVFRRFLSIRRWLECKPIRKECASHLPPLKRSQFRANRH